MKFIKEKENLETALGKIENPSIRMIAECSLKAARKALNYSRSNQIQYVVDEIDRNMPKALRQRKEHETS